MITTISKQGGRRYPQLRSTWLAFTGFLPARGSSLTPTTAAISGGVIGGTTEDDIRAGGRTVIITLTSDTWAAAGAAFNAQRQNIINGMVSAGAEAFGWNAVVVSLQGVAGVVRTNATQVTITLDAFPTYDITANETITVTVPASALVTSLVAVVAVPTFTIAFVPVPPVVPVAQATPGFQTRGRLPRLETRERIESGADKLARRIREGTLPAPTPHAEPEVEQAQREYAEKSAKIAKAIWRFRGESAQLRVQIARLEAAQAKRQSAKQAHAITLKQQALALAQVQEAAMIEQMEVLDVAAVAFAVLGMIYGGTLQ